MENGKWKMENVERTCLAGRAKSRFAGEDGKMDNSLCLIKY
jgi:hypothetical protein